MMLASCVTRFETDAYTITVRDTLYREHVRNAPGNGGENGTVFPSSRDTRIFRESLSYDSTYERQYPAFLRYGGIEFAGMITGSSNLGLSAGILGLYTLLDTTNLSTLFNTGFQSKGSQNSLFKGRLLRIVPVEYQLHWFDEAPNWTIGWSAYESIAADENSDNTLRSVGTNVYVRKRFWFRERPPYLFASPFVGFSLFPSLYINAGAELTFGSFGGFNLRAYAGLATGFTWSDAISAGTKSKSITTPYIGLGVSALDFINKVSETQHEWKDYLHSAIEMSAIDIDILDALAGYDNLFKVNATIPVSGAAIQIATAHFPLSFGDGHWWAGTSLIKFFALGFSQATFSTLPLRFGYRHYLLAEDLTFEPFIEANYYPSTYADIGFRLRLNTFHDITFGLLFGYANGSTGSFVNKLLIAQGSSHPANFNTLYVGISFSPKDRMLTPERVKELDKLVRW